MTNKYQHHIDRGYRVTSRAWGMIARVDRPDWKEYMASKHPSGRAWVKSLGDTAADHYRRVYSKDRLEIKYAAKYIPNSSFDPIGYVP